MNVCLINPPFLKQGGVMGSGCHSSPLSIAYLVSYLKSRVKNVKILFIDAEGEGYSVQEVIKKVKDFKPLIIGISCTTPSMDYVFRIAKECKTRNNHVVLGGPHPTALPVRTVRHEGVDIIVYGEGEVTFYETINAILKNKSLKKVKGIYYKKKNNVVGNPPRELINDLDSLPFPDRTIFKNNYFTGILSSRGCPFDCLHCSSKLIWRRKVRLRSASNVVKEIEECYKKLGSREFDFYDDTFTINKKRTIDICKKIINKGLDISWICLARVDTIDEELLDYMKRAGCKKISFGLESGSEKILRRMRKKVDLNTAREAIRMVNSAGIESGASFMFGNLGETEQTIRQTISFAKSLNLGKVTFFITTPYPGTDLFKIVEKKGRVKEPINWFDFSPLGKGSIIPVQDELSGEELLYWQKRAFREFYYRPAYFFETLKKVKSWKDLKNTMNNFLLFLRIINK